VFDHRQLIGDGLANLPYDLEIGKKKQNKTIAKS
jgi:hypothetical protein